MTTPGAACLPSPDVLTVTRMNNDVARLPGSLSEFAGTHPSVSFCHVGRWWLAWIPAAGATCTCSGEMIRGRDAAELLVKLAAALGG